MKKLLVVVDPGFEAGKDLYLKQIAEEEKDIVLLTNVDQRVDIDPWWLRHVDAKRVVPVRFRETAAAAQKLEHWSRKNQVQFAGFYTYFEEAVPLTNQLASHFKSTLTCKGDIRATRHKGRMRSAVTAAGLRQPKFFVCRTAESAKKAVEAVGVPCVMKPAQFLASMGVVKLTSADADTVERAFKMASTMDIAEEDTRYAYGLSADVLVEEYLPADFEMSCEGVVQAGQLLDFFCTGKTLGKEPYFVELVHWHPMRLSSPLMKCLEADLRKIVQALSLHSCIVHAEFRVKEDVPTLIEIAARMAGGHIPEVIEDATGVSLVRLGTELAKGAKTVSIKRTRDGFASVFFIENQVQFDRAKAMGPGELVQYPPGQGHFGHYRPQLSGEDEVFAVNQKLYSD